VYWWDWESPARGGGRCRDWAGTLAGRRRSVTTGYGEDLLMAYVGWDPKDFVAHAPDRSGRGLFPSMTRAEEERFLWDNCCDAGADVPTGWRDTYYVFQCRHCGALAGNWDCD
jgi:hypothetical protein